MLCALEYSISIVLRNCFLPILIIQYDLLGIQITTLYAKYSILSSNHRNSQVTNVGSLTILHPGSHSDLSIE